jgi:hypothetical protein
MLAKLGQLETKCIVNNQQMIVTMYGEQMGSGENVRIESLVQDSKMCEAARIHALFSMLG